ncbi:MAG: hypothetical protein K0R18_2055 [Bacillales bacterium]|jgi:flagellar basal body-associated protein FliL|nr:hypothetical protein [Bacillales bacterium]
MTEVNQHEGQADLEIEQKPFRKSPAVKKTSKEMILFILLVVNIIISTISLVGIAYTVSKEKDRTEQIGQIGKNGVMNGNFIQRGQMPNGGSFQTNPNQGGSTN